MQISYIRYIYIIFNYIYYIYIHNIYSKKMSVSEEISNITNLHTN